MNCDDALHILLNPTHRERGAALTYIQNNPDCLARLDQLARAVLSNIEYELSCAEARRQLADYYTHQVNQQDAAAYPDLHAHLHRCPYCQAEHQALQEAMQTVATSSFPIVTQAPQFDLSFIDSPLPSLRPIAEIWMRVANVRKLFQSIEVTIRRGVAEIVALTAQLQPSPVALATRLRADIDQAKATAFILPDEEQSIHFQVDTAPSVDETILLTVHVFNIENASPLPDVRMTLLTAAGSLVADSLTDEKGAIQFPRLAANHYIIQAQWNDQIWEIPIAVTSAHTN
jgi:hypothetical protein